MRPVVFCADRHFLQHAAIAAVSAVTAACRGPVRLQVPSCDADDDVEALYQALRPCVHIELFVCKVEPKTFAGLSVDWLLTKAVCPRFLAVPYVSAPQGPLLSVSRQNAMTP